MLLLDEPTPHGWLTVLSLPEPNTPEAETLLAQLHPEEESAASTFRHTRRLTYAGGRAALRLALRRLPLPDPTALPILNTTRGAPALPEALPIKVSISHKKRAACALAAQHEPGFVGVDIEEIGAASDRSARMILTEGEVRAVFALSAQERALQLALRFSLKESLYKALDPFVQRYVGFKEVEAWPAPDGQARLLLQLKTGEGGFEVDGRWRALGAHVLTSVRVRRTLSTAAPSSL